MAGLAWVTGAAGLIGSHIMAAGLHRSGRTGSWRLRALTRQELDLCDAPALDRAFHQEPPDLIIHCAALTRSAVCQTDPALAWRLNHHVTEHLAALASDRRLVFLSTDLVFDGASGHYTESAPVNPLSVYGETKAAAEQVVLRNPRALVIRTSLNAGPSPTRDRGFDEQLRLAWAKGETTTLFTDEFRSPIPAAVTAKALWELVDQGQRGLFHVAGADRLSRWELGQLLKERWPEPPPRIQPASCRQYTGPPRAPDTSLDCGKVQALLSFALPGFREWLRSRPAS